MNRWIEVVGFPLVVVNYDESSEILSVRQEGRMTYLKQDTNDTRWPIPLTYRLGDKSSEEKRLWLLNEQTGTRDAQAK